MLDKINLTLAVGADLDVMRREPAFVLTDLKTGEGVGEIIAWIERDVLFV